MLKKVFDLFARYPVEPGVRPDSFSETDRNVLPVGHTKLLTYQSVPDKFYFLLFGAIRVRLAAHVPLRTELIIVRSVSGAVGVGLLAEIKRSALVIWLWSNRWVRAYGSLVDGVAYRSATWSHPLSDLIDWFRSGPLWKQLQEQSGAQPSLKIGNIEVADLIIDSFLRFKPSPYFDVKDLFVRRLIWQAMRDIRQAKAYFNKKKPRWYLTSYTTYLEHGIPARVALDHGVEVWSFGSLNSFAKRLTSNDSYHTLDFSGYRAGFDALDKQQDRLNSARIQLEKRLSGGIDVATSYMRKSAYGQKKSELPHDLEGAVVIFLHDFYDSPHVYPELLFQDFWSWACFTVDILQKYGIHFFLKPHPNQISLSDKALHRLKQKYPDMQWLPATVSNVQLAEAGIACGVTVYGTVAHELAYLGVPSIACARHPHHAFNFCRISRTKADYEIMLKDYKVKTLSKEDMQRQALAFYYMHNLHCIGNERNLQQSFVDLWKLCNLESVNVTELMCAYQTLVHLPAFDEFITRLMVGNEINSHN